MPSGVIQTPSVCRHISDVASWGITTKLPALSNTYMWCDWSGSLYSHLAFMGSIWDVSYTRSIFQALMLCPWLVAMLPMFVVIVAFYLIPFCCFDPLLWCISPSSMKPNPTMEQWCLEMAHIMSARNPSSASIWNSGVLTAASIWGPAPLPCPMLAMGAPHTLHPCNVFELLYMDWAWCCILWSMPIILWTATLSAPSWYKLSAAIISTILS